MRPNIEEIRSKTEKLRVNIWFRENLFSLINYIDELENMPLVQTVVKLQEENERLTTALEVANDCLFGNTYDDKVLEEAYQVISQALQKRSESK